MYADVRLENDRLLVQTKRLSKLIGVSERTIATWVSDGCPKERRGWFDLEEVLRWRGMMAGVKGAGSKEMTLNEQKMEAEIKLKTAQAEIAEFKQDINAGKYLERAFVVSELRDFFAVFRRAVNIIPSRMAVMMSTYIDPLEARRAEKKMTEIVNEALEELSVGGVFSAKQKD